MEPHLHRRLSALRHFCLLCTAGPGRCETRWEYVGVVAGGGPGSGLRGVLAVTAPWEQAGGVPSEPPGCTCTLAAVPQSGAQGSGRHCPPSQCPGACLLHGTHALAQGPGVCVCRVCSALWMRVRNCAEMRINKCPPPNSASSLTSEPPARRLCVPGRRCHPRPDTRPRVCWQHVGRWLTQTRKTSKW